MFHLHFTLFQVSTSDKFSQESSLNPTSRSHQLYMPRSEDTRFQFIPFHVSFTFLVLLFWTFLVHFSRPPTPTQLSKGVGEPQNRTSNVQNRDSKSKRDPKKSFSKFQAPAFIWHIPRESRAPCSLENKCIIWWENFYNFDIQCTTVQDQVFKLFQVTQLQTNALLYPEYNRNTYLNCTLNFTASPLEFQLFKFIMIIHLMQKEVIYFFMHLVLFSLFMIIQSVQWGEPKYKKIETQIECILQRRLPINGSVSFNQKILRICI